MERKYALVADFQYNLGMIRNLKGSGEDPKKYIRNAKKVIRKMRRIDSTLAFQFEHSLKSTIKGSKGAGQ